MRDVDPLTVFREATWEEALERAAGGLKKNTCRAGWQALAGFGSAKGSNEEACLFQKLVRQGFGTNNVDHRTRLCHASSVAALMEGIGSGAVSAPFNDAMKADCIIVIGAADHQPSGRRDLFQAGRQARRQADRNRPARPGSDAPCLPLSAASRRACCAMSPAPTPPLSVRSSFGAWAFPSTRTVPTMRTA
jgi:anaerobic selenocysteine-containing dehydrogenase